MRNNVNPMDLPGEVGGTDGFLVRIDPGCEVTAWKRDIGIANTVTWSPDHTRFYFADTLRNEVYVYDYDAATGSIQGERTFFAGSSVGKLRRSTMDSAGYLWNCRYGGHSIVRVSPDGAIDRVIEMPVSNVTTCTFGGPDLTTLYVTSAALSALRPESASPAACLPSKPISRDSPRLASARDEDRPAKPMPPPVADDRFLWSAVRSSRGAPWRDTRKTRAIPGSSWQCWCICFFNYADRQAVFSVFPLWRRKCI